MFKLREHLQRLYRSLDFANLDPGMTLEEMEEVTREVVEANSPLLDSKDDFIGLRDTARNRPAWTFLDGRRTFEDELGVIVDKPNHASLYSAKQAGENPKQWRVFPVQAPSRSQFSGWRRFPAAQSSLLR